MYAVDDDRARPGIVSPCIGEGVKLGRIVDGDPLDRALNSIVLAAILEMEDSNLATLAI
jgi:hypothetical protein